MAQLPGLGNGRAGSRERERWIGKKRGDEPRPFLSKGDVETEVPTGEPGRECEVQHRHFKSQISGLERDTEADCPFG